MHNAQPTDANLLYVTKKRSRKPQLLAFGAWLEQKRGKATTREQISIKLRALGVPLGGSTLAQYEKGTVWAPDPGVLWGLSKIYDYRLEQAIEVLKRNRANPDLRLSDILEPGPEVQRIPPQQEDSDGQASAREEIEALGKQLTAYEVRFAQAREFASKVVELLILSDEELAAARARTERRGVDRKTG